MQATDWIRILEPALHAHLAIRCHRAYRHDLRNGLQGIYGGFDALSRLLQAPKDNARVERITDFVRQAVTNHEKSLERVLLSLAPLEQAAEPIDVSALLTELARFLTNDAAVHRVSLRSNIAQPVTALVRAPKLRLVLLGLMVDAIDAMPSGGVLQVGTRMNAAAWIELADTRAAPLAAAPAELDLHDSPPHRGWLGYVVSQLIAAEGGSVEYAPADGGGWRITLQLPAAAS